MDEQTGNTEATSEDRLERLVDGELPQAEYRAVLAALDEEPGGWRRCALAFLEAQALVKDLGAAVSHDRITSASPSKSRGVSGSGLSSLLAMAASFLVAFALGLVIPKFFNSVQQDSTPLGNLITKSADDTLPDGDGFVPSMPREIGNVQLVMDGPGGETTEAGRIPVLDVGQDIERYLSNESPEFGPELVELLRERGYDLRRQQQYFPAPLDDGRQIIVPVDGYQITPVSLRY